MIRLLGILSISGWRARDRRQLYRFLDRDGRAWIEHSDDHIVFHVALPHPMIEAEPFARRCAVALHRACADIGLRGAYFAIDGNVVGQRVAIFPDREFAERLFRRARRERRNFSPLGGSLGLRNSSRGVASSRISIASRYNFIASS